MAGTYWLWCCRRRSSQCGGWALHHPPRLPPGPAPPRPPAPPASSVGGQEAPVGAGGARSEWPATVCPAQGSMGAVPLVPGLEVRWALVCVHACTCVCICEHLCMHVCMGWTWWCTPPPCECHHPMNTRAPCTPSHREELCLSLVTKGFPRCCGLPLG